MKHLLLFITLLFIVRIVLNGQPIPSTDENIPFLVTFGNEAPKSCGDNDNIQSVLVIIPESIIEEFYIRIFDPDIGGEFDDIIGETNTSTTFAIYGSYNILPDDTCNEEPIFINEFCSDAKYDKSWYFFGPIKPKEGEYYENLKSYIFRITASGNSGNDGNYYRYYISSEDSQNIPIEGVNYWTNDITFSTHKSPGELSHLYPYIDSTFSYIKIRNFNLADSSFIRFISTERAYMLNTSGIGKWAEDTIKIKPGEIFTFLDLQIIRNRNNYKENVVTVIFSDLNDKPLFPVSWKARDYYYGVKE